MLHATLEVAEEQGLPPFEEPFSGWPLWLRLLLLLGMRIHLLLLGHTCRRRLLLLLGWNLFLFFWLAFRLPTGGLDLAIILFIWLLLPLIVIASVARSSFFLLNYLFLSFFSSGGFFDLSALLWDFGSSRISFRSLSNFGRFRRRYLLLLGSGVAIFFLVIRLILLESLLSGRACQEGVDGRLRLRRLLRCLSRWSHRCLLLFHLCCRSWLNHVRLDLLHHLLRIEH